MKKTVVLLAVCFLIFTLFRYPDAMLYASINGIQLWLTKVFPSLFPFMVSCGLLLRFGIAEKIGTRLSPLTQRIFGLNGIAAFPFLFGILSGYPMGAKITADLYTQKKITIEEAEHILVFSNAPGALFLVGTIGTVFFGMPVLGYLLLLSTFLGSIATGILWRFRKKSTLTPRNYFPQTKEISIVSAFALSVSDAMQNILIIGGYLIFFAAFCEAINQTGLFYFFSVLPQEFPIHAETITGFFSGILEMTNGAYLLSISADALAIRLTLVAFLVSFGGLSVLGQTFGILCGVPIEKKAYLAGKFSHAMFSSFFFQIIFLFWTKGIKKAVPVFFSFTETDSSFFFFLPIIFVLCTLSYLLLQKK